jgi:sulfhydrogenase subunit gamma (sulfur reductase)
MSELLPREAIVIDRIEESRTIFTLRMEFADSHAQEVFSFDPGQFNMLYLHGVGEIPISIVSDPEDDHFFDHTIRSVGRVTRGMERLQVGDSLGVRGPFGRGWPMDQASGRDLLLITGGLGCAPLVSVVNYLLRRREEYGRIVLLQGVRHADDLIWRERYDRWSREKDTEVLLAADVITEHWRGHQGNVVALLEHVEIDPANTLVMLCGPEVMMQAAIGHLLERGFSDRQLWLSMERNMQCGIGQCGHCQLGPRFVCRDGPVFCYSEVCDLLGVKGV